MTVTEQPTAAVGDCNGCYDPSHKVWVLELVACTVRLCRTCLAAVKEATR